MKTQNKKRLFTPINAVTAWLDGDFGIGDEAARIAAIRNDPEVTLSDDEITDVILDAMEEGLDARTCLERLCR